LAAPKSADKPQLLPRCRFALGQGLVGIFGRQHQVDDLSQQRPPPARRVKSADKLRSFQEKMPVVAIGAGIRAVRCGKESLKRLGGNEIGFGIDRSPKNLERQSTPQRLLPGSRVDRNGGPGVVQKFGQFAATDEMDPVRHPMQSRKTPDFGQKRYPAILKRMGFEDEVVMLGGAFGKAVNHQGEEVGHAGEGRMIPKACVMFELQDREMIGEPAVPDAAGCEAAFQPVQRHEKEALEIKLEFLPHGQRAVWPEVPVGVKAKGHETVVKGTPEHMLAHVTPGRWHIGQVKIDLRQRALHVSHRQVHQPRVAVRPAPFVGHPVGAKIAFFEHVHGDATGVGQCDRLGMDPSRVAIKHKVGDGVPRQEIGTGGGPLVLRVLERDVARTGPCDPVAKVEADAPNLGPGCADKLAQPVEPGAMRALQKEKVAWAGQKGAMRSGSRQHRAEAL
jgi:hypothetical protein